MEKSHAIPPASLHPCPSIVLVMHKAILRRDLAKIVTEERLADVTDTIARAEADHDIQEPSVPKNINFNYVAVTLSTSRRGSFQDK